MASYSLDQAALINALDSLETVARPILHEGQTFPFSKIARSPKARKSLDRAGVGPRQVMIGYFQGRKEH